VAAVARQGKVEDSPAARRLAWARMSLLVLYFNPSGELLLLLLLLLLLVHYCCCWYCCCSTKRKEQEKNHIGVGTIAVGV
jgi:hypothetical protein